jgi:Domain of unknown function (DUF3472)/Domain of unknown function (DUF5077)/FKBP-type peptidyl-prolyl cis-trans isomerase
MKRILMFFASALLQTFVLAQPKIVLPRYTAYALPAEGEEGQYPLLHNVEHDVLNWFNPRQTIHFFFHVKDTGTVKLTLELGSRTASGIIKWTCNGQQKLIAVPKGDEYIPKRVSGGKLSFSKPGFYELTLSCVKMTGTQPPNLGDIILTGNIASTIHTNHKPRKNSASVHLSYPIKDSTQAIGFYNELTIPKGFDYLYTYYMACGFRRGYFGMQVNSPTERRIIFSVWDSGTVPDDRSKVKPEDLVQPTGKGEGVVAEGFGNEGTGGHSHWVYNWKTDSTYRFYVTALPDSNETYYSGYFFVPELQQWKLIASFRSPKDGKYLNGLYSFVENFDGKNGQLQRKALIGNQWIQTEDRKWQELTKAKFTYDATGKAGDRIDYEAGADNDHFYLGNGGFKEANVKYADTFVRKPTQIPPVIDLYKNADSAVQTAKEKQQIFAAIAAGKLDTTGSVNGVYYKILKEGTGRNVLLSDTVVAFYKGSILNGEIFDQTKTEPATFPLARLIKGWQVAVPMCKVGGTIRLIIPSAIAYSIRTRGPKIPPNSVLVFDIEVLSVK